ncbi:Stage V sporulation protein D [Thermotalea metallivorans]|uniref:Stage V sporulation protein D n=1 Tax=Thermotalea metallivorans TaxID=520762 RepID=A0A140L896_9FIRM|nr:Stage V sporulation protein D [Thermotalea metallivorans]
MFFLQTRAERKKRELWPELQDHYQKRLMLMGVSFTCILFLLIGRLAYIQLMKGHDYKNRAMRQWFKELPAGINRGKIYDRNMIPLTNRNKSSYLILYPDIFQRSQENLEIISELTKISPYVLKYEVLASHRPIQLEVKNYDINFIKKVFTMRGVYPIDREERYSRNGLASHVIGYINKIDNVGSKGIEKQLDDILTENQSDMLGAIVDAQKRMIPGLGYKTIESNPGKIKKNIVLTIDYRVQRIIEEAFDKYHQKGSVVVLDAQNGDILGMVSRPNYDQNNVAAYLESNNKELYNRAVQMAYPPGSVFKIVVAAAALEYGLVDLKDTFYCKGYEKIDGVVMKCNSYEDGGHGEINLEKAFAVSCNSAFIQLGQQVGGKKVMEMAKNLGFGSPTNIELPEETKGNLPSEDYMKGAGIGNISIGQGTLEATPLQIAKLTSVIANDGVMRDIRLLKKIVDEKGNVLQENFPEKSSRVLSEGTARKIQQMMEKVVKEGTGSKIHLDDFGGAAGKTGSAEAFSEGRPVVHAWFTGYFPLKTPKYIITIIIEGGGGGGKVAAPLFHEIGERIALLEK